MEPNDRSLEESQSKPERDVIQNATEQAGFLPADAVTTSTSSTAATSSVSTTNPTKLMVIIALYISIGIAGVMVFVTMQTPGSEVLQSGETIADSTPPPAVEERESVPAESATGVKLIQNVPVAPGFAAEEPAPDDPVARVETTPPATTPSPAPEETPEVEPSEAYVALLSPNTGTFTAEGIKAISWEASSQLAGCDYETYLQNTEGIQVERNSAVVPDAGSNGLVRGGSSYDASVLDGSYKVYISVSCADGSRYADISSSWLSFTAVENDEPFTLEPYAHHAETESRSLSYGDQITYGYRGNKAVSSVPGFTVKEYFIVEGTNYELGTTAYDKHKFTTLYLAQPVNESIACTADDPLRQYMEPNLRAEGYDDSVIDQVCEAMSAARFEDGTYTYKVELVSDNGVVIDSFEATSFTISQ